MDVADKLEKLNNLKEKGIISEEEFLSQKNKILNRRPYLKIFVIFSVAMFICLFVYLYLNNSKKESILHADGTPYGVPVDVSLLEFSTSNQVLGINPDYLEEKLGVPRVKNEYLVTHLVGGCEVSYSLKNNIISSFSVYVNNKCNPIINGEKITHNTTYGELLNNNTTGIYSAWCLYMCGNAADPTISLRYNGSRSNNFINITYDTDYDQVSGAIGMWESSIRSALRIGPHDYSDALSCVANAPSNVANALRGVTVRFVRVDQDFEGVC